MAQSDYFLKIDGVQGEATDDKHKNEIDVLSWSWGESNAATFGSGGGGGAGKVQMQDLHFTMKVSKASPVLMLSCASGKHIAKAELFARKAGGAQEEYMKFTLSDVMVSSYQTGGSGGDVVPVDQVALSYSKIEMEYKPQDAKGAMGSPVKAGWDRAKNVKV
jgi:type VI secretion system secreted protein Hcp